MSSEDDFKKFLLSENNKFKITDITFMPSKSSHFVFKGKFDIERLEGNTIDPHEDHIEHFNDTFFHYMLPVFYKLIV